MIVKTTAKILCVKVIDKRDKQTKEKTGEKMLLGSFLIDSDLMHITTGSVTEMFLPKEIAEEFNLDDYKPFQNVELNLNLTLGSEYYDLVSIKPLR